MSLNDINRFRRKVFYGEKRAAIVCVERGEDSRSKGVSGSCAQVGGDAAEDDGNDVYCCPKLQAA